MKLNELTIKEYSNLLAAKKSFPGGGSAVALVMELACDLGLMIGNFTIDKKGYENVQNEIIIINDKLTKIKIRANELIEEDGVAYNNVVSAFKTKDKKLIENASKEACEVPYELYSLSLEVESILKNLYEIGNKNLIPDAKIGLNLCSAVKEGCIVNIECNLSHLNEKDKEKYLAIINS